MPNPAFVAQLIVKRITSISLFLMTAAACVTVIFVNELKPTSAGALALFAVWLVLPYVAMSAALIMFSRKQDASAHRPVVAVLVSIGGIVFLLDVIFWHPDAQGAIAVLMTPILQAFALAILLPVGSWVSRIARG